MANEGVAYFRESGSINARAAQAYLILIGHAHAGRLVTYEELGEQMGHVPMLGSTLDRMAAWTKERDLPDLASIVVSKEHGRPSSLNEAGTHPYAVTLEQWPGVLAKVREMDWFAIVPPTGTSIAAAWERFAKSSPQGSAQT